jgi:hypothetical protein
MGRRYSSGQTKVRQTNKIILQPIAAMQLLKNSFRAAVSFGKKITFGMKWGFCCIFVLLKMNLPGKVLPKEGVFCVSSLFFVIFCRIEF